jgi:hypothetical protein
MKDELPKLLFTRNLEEGRERERPRRIRKEKI